MRLAGYQPQYFPRLHYFARILDSDIFVISDTFQYVRAHHYPTADGKGRRDKSYQADTPIKSGTGVQLLPVPVLHKGRLPINKTSIAYSTSWQDDHLKTIRLTYSPSPNFNALFPSIEHLIHQQYHSLGDLTTATMLWALHWIITGAVEHAASISIQSINKTLAAQHPFRLHTIVVRSATEHTIANENSDATDEIIATCKVFGANEYYCGGTAAVTYLDMSRLKRNDITPIVQQWTLSPYAQRFMNIGFIPNLSILDLMMNEDPERARALLQSS